MTGLPPFATVLLHDPDLDQGDSDLDRFSDLDRCTRSKSESPVTGRKGGRPGARAAQFSQRQRRSGGPEPGGRVEVAGPPRAAGEPKGGPDQAWERRQAAAAATVVAAAAAAGRQREGLTVGGDTA